jgi:[ribosomal protein S5]-alanine N-acetyltransferase
VIVTETSRLILRYFTADDLDELAAILGDHQVMRYSIGGIKTRSQTQDFLNWILSNYEKYGFGLYAVIERENQVLIGFCGLLVWFFEEVQEIEMGYRFAKEHWGQGLGTEAATAVRDYAWQKLNLKRLICIIQPENTRSIRVAKKLGMEHERNMFFQGLNVGIYSI